MTEGAATPAPALDPAEERLRAVDRKGQSDALTFAFGDIGSFTFGIARIGVAAGEDRSVSGLALLFDGAEVAAVRLDGGRETEAADWSELDAAGIATEVTEPLRRWRVSFDGGGEGGFELAFEALGQAAQIDPEGAAAHAGGMVGYEHACRVSGSVRIGTQTREIACLGQRGHSWGAPDWERMTLARSIGAWLSDDLALTATAIRPAGAREHEHELLEAVLLAGDPLSPTPIAEPRLSTIYDGDGRHRRAGLELWVYDEDDFPRRCAGEVLCGTSLDLGRLALQSAFFRWHMDGREGVGRYDVIRRA